MSAGGSGLRAPDRAASSSPCSALPSPEAALSTSTWRMARAALLEIATPIEIRFAQQFHMLIDARSSQRVRSGIPLKRGRRSRRSSTYRSDCSSRAVDGRPSVPGSRISVPTTCPLAPVCSSAVAAHARLATSQGPPSACATIRDFHPIRSILFQWSTGNTCAALLIWLAVLAGVVVLPLC